MVNTKRNKSSSNKSSTHKAQTAIDIDEVGEVLRPAKDRFDRMDLGSYIRTDNVPLVIGAFALGAIAGVLGAMYLPALRDSQLVIGIGDKLTQAKAAVMEKVSQAREAAGVGGATGANQQVS